MDIENGGHEEVYKPLTTKKHAPPESRASRRYALFLIGIKVLCLLMVLSLLGYYVYVTVTVDDATAQLIRDVGKLKQRNHHHHDHHNKSDDNDVPEWFEEVLNLTRMGFVHISLKPFPDAAPPPLPPPPQPHTTTHSSRTTTTASEPTTIATTAKRTPPPTTTTTTVEPPTTLSSTTTTTTTESTTEDSPSESTTTTTSTTTESGDDYTA
jgi:hypothetical protein